MPCAGSTSLCAALNILGIPSLHYQVPHPDSGNLKKVILKNLKFKRRLFYPYDEEYIGFCDFDGEDFYKILFEMYPDSKFIYTWREYDPWIKSVMKLEQNLYIKKYNKTLPNKIFKARKNRRTTYWNSVKVIPEFFKNNSSRFLEMKICDGNDDSWEKLCNFLEMDIPNVNFPHLPSNNTLYNYKLLEL